jgi:hypothetical protein
MSFLLFVGLYNICEAGEYILCSLPAAPAGNQINLTRVVLSRCRHVVARNCIGASGRSRLEASILKS